MHPTIGYYQLSQSHLAGLRHQAQRTALARAARQARRAWPHLSSHPGPNLPGIARMVLTAFASRST